MKTFLLPLLSFSLALPLAAATTASPASKPATIKSTPAPAAAPAPSPAPAPAASTVTLNAYMNALSDAITLSKDEKQDIQTYYLDDGAKLQQILNDPSLSPLQQTGQVDDLRNARNAKIEALLRDVDRQTAFLKIEADYRVALVELAADGGLVPATPPPNVPQPTSTPPAKAGTPPAGPGAS